jgi:PDZ domain-containing protein
MTLNSNRIAGYTMGGTPVYEGDTSVVDLGGDCHYVPPASLSTKRKDEMKKVKGVRVYGTRKGGAARKAGITSGDVITHVNGRRVFRPKDISSALWRVYPGEKALIKFHYNGGIVEKVKLVAVGRSVKNSKHPSLGIFTTKNGWNEYRENDTKPMLKKESPAPKVKVGLAIAHHNPANQPEMIEMSLPSFDKPMVGENAKLKAKATRMAVADEVTKAKAKAVNRIESNDEDYFGKKAADELALVKGLLNDRKGADAYMAARNLRRDLEAANAEKLEAAGAEVSDYLKSMKAANIEEPRKARKLSRLGKIVVGTIVTVVSVPACYYAASAISGAIISTF